MNIYRLKLELMQFGIEPTDDALDALPHNRFGEVAYKDYPTTGGLILSLPQEMYVNVPIKYNAQTGKSFYLEYNGSFRIKRQELDIQTKLLPPPRFALDNTKTSKGEPVRNMVMTHADRVRISAIAGCAFNCRFCNMPSLLYQKYSIQELEEAFNIALNDSLAKPVHALISGGTPFAEKEDYKYLNDIYQYFPTTYPDIDFDVMLIPRTIDPDEPQTKQNYRKFLQFLKNSGVSSLSVNIELFNDSLRRKIAPEKGDIGTENYLLFLQQAADIFENRIRSILILGLESMEHTIAGVGEIAKRGCLPELSPFIPDPGAFLAREKVPSVDFLEQTLLKAGEKTEQYGVQLKPFCKLCGHNIITL